MTEAKPRPATEAPPKRDTESEPRDDQDLDLDVEEIDDGDRLKEGFTGQER